MLDTEVVTIRFTCKPEERAQVEDWFRRHAIPALSAAVRDRRPLRLREVE